MTAAQRREKAIFDRVLDLLSQGEKDEDIAAELNLEDDEFADLKGKVLQEHGEALRRKTPERIYAEYVIDSRGTLRMVNEAIVEMQTSLQSDPKAAGRVGPALASLIRARHDVIGDLIKMGQTLGIVDKQDTEGQKIGGIIIAGVSESQMRDFIQTELRKFSALASEQPIELVEIGTLHYGEPGRPDEIKAVPEAPETGESDD